MSCESFSGTTQGQKRIEASKFSLSSFLTFPSSEPDDLPTNDPPLRSSNEYVLHLGTDSLNALEEERGLNVALLAPCSILNSGAPVIYSYDEPQCNMDDLGQSIDLNEFQIESQYGLHPDFEAWLSARAESDDTISVITTAKIGPGHWSDGDAEDYSAQRLLDTADEGLSIEAETLDRSAYQNLDWCQDEEGDEPDYDHEMDGDRTVVVVQESQFEVRGMSQILSERTLSSKESQDGGMEQSFPKEEDSRSTHDNTAVFSMDQSTSEKVEDLVPEKFRLGYEDDQNTANSSVRARKRKRSSIKRGEENRLSDESDDLSDIISKSSDSLWERRGYSDLSEELSQESGDEEFSISSRTRASKSNQRFKKSHIEGNMYRGAHHVDVQAKQPKGRATRWGSKSNDSENDMSWGRGGKQTRERVKSGSSGRSTGMKPAEKREYHRMLQKRSRERKKEYVASMESLVISLKGENSRLKKELAELKAAQEEKNWNGTTKTTTESFGIARSGIEPHAASETTTFLQSQGQTKGNQRMEDQRKDKGNRPVKLRLFTRSSISSRGAHKELHSETDHITAEGAADKSNTAFVINGINLQNTRDLKGSGDFHPDERKTARNEEEKWNWTIKSGEVEPRIEKKRGVPPKRIAKSGKELPMFSATIIRINPTGPGRDSSRGSQAVSTKERLVTSSKVAVSITDQFGESTRFEGTVGTLTDNGLNSSAPRFAQAEFGAPTFGNSKTPLPSFRKRGSGGITTNCSSTDALETAASTLVNLSKAPIHERDSLGKANGSTLKSERIQLTRQAMKGIAKVDGADRGISLSGRNGRR